MASEANAIKEPAQQVLFPDLVSNYQEGRDELNLAEFPISAIGNRLDPSVKTILFQDAAFDKSTGETITRKLTIAAVRGTESPDSSDNTPKKPSIACPFFRGKYKHQRTAATTQSSETADGWRGGCSSSRRDGRERCAAALDEASKDSSHDSCPTRASRCRPKRGQRLHRGGCSS